MPLVSVEQLVRDDGKLEVRVHNCSGTSSMSVMTHNFASTAGGDMVFQSGSQDDEQPCAIIFSLRSSHPHLFYYRGAAGGEGPATTRTYLTPSVSALSPEEERAAIVSASEQEWGAHGLSSVAVPVGPPSAAADGGGVVGGSSSSYPPGRFGADSFNGQSANNSGVFGPSSAAAVGTAATAVSTVSNRPTLVREEIADGVLLPGERRTFILDLDDPQYLRDYFQVRVSAREKEALRTRHHQQHRASQAGSTRPPKQRRVTAVRRGPAPHTLPPPAPPKKCASDAMSSSSTAFSLERGSELSSLSGGPALMRTATSAFNQDQPPSPVAPTAKLSCPLGSSGLLDSRVPPGRAMDSSHLHSTTDDEDEDDELTSSAVPYSRMTINVESEPATSPARDNRLADHAHRPSAPTLSEEDEEGESSASHRGHSRQAINHTHRPDGSDPSAYPVEDPPPTISSRLNGAQKNGGDGNGTGRAPVNTDTALMDWNESLQDSTSSSASLRDDQRTPLFRRDRSHLSAGLESSVGAGTAGASTSSAPPPMLTVYYSRLGDENKCVEKARKWLKKEAKSYTAWQENFIKNAVKWEKKRDRRRSTAEGSLADSGSNAVGRVRGAACARLLPPSLGDPVRWRRNTRANADHVTAEAFSNVSIVRSRAAYSRYYGAILQEEMGAGKVASAILALTAPYASTHSNGVSKSAQKMFNTSRVGDGVVVQPLRWQLFVPRQPHRKHPLNTPGSGAADLTLASLNSMLWHADASQSSAPSHGLLSTWPQEASDPYQRHTPVGRSSLMSVDEATDRGRSGSSRMPDGRRGGGATVPRRASPVSPGESDRGASPEAISKRAAPLGSSLRAGRGLALLEDSISISGSFDAAEGDGISLPEDHSRAGWPVTSEGLMENRSAASSCSTTSAAPIIHSTVRASPANGSDPLHSCCTSSASPPPPVGFDATRSFLSAAAVERAATFSPAAVEVLGSRHPAETEYLHDLSYPDAITSPLIAFSNAARPVKDNTVWGSLMSTGSRGQGSLLGADELSVSGRAGRVCTPPQTNACAALESSQRSQGPACGSDAGRAQKRSISRFNNYLRSCIASSTRDNKGSETASSSERGFPQGDTYPAEDSAESSCTHSFAGAAVESAGIMPSLEESGLGLSSPSGMRPLTTAPPSSLLRRPAPVAPSMNATLACTPRSGQAFLGERVMKGGALGALALTLSLLVQLAVVLARRVHDVIAPVVGRAVAIAVEQMPGVASSAWNMLVDVVLADDNVRVLQKVMVPLLGVMGLWLVSAMVWSSAGSIIAENDFDRPL